MIKAWRLSRRKYARSAFEGIGSMRHGARWNPPGHPVVYTSANLSLACLEFVVHLSLDDLPRDLVAIPASIPPELRIETIEADDLPRNWKRFPFPKALQKIGADWIERGESAVLSVPSVIVPMERNLLLNPAHPEFGSILVEAPTAFPLDRRLKKG